MLSTRRHNAFLYATLAAGLFITILVGLISRSGVQSWTFRIIYALMCVALLADVVRRFKVQGSRFKVQDSGFKSSISLAVIQLGLVVALFGGAVGGQLREEERLKVSEGTTELFRGLSVTLDDFTMDTYPNGRPKRFASDVVVRTADDKTVSGTVEVNHPLSVGGWKIYQYDYDSEAGAESTYTVLGMVREPWQGVMLAGILLMIAGAILLFFVPSDKKGATSPNQRPKKKYVWIIWGSAMVAATFFLFILFSPQIVSKMPVPALQSPWFAPHVLVYIMAYAMAIVSAVMAIYLLVCGKRRREAVGLDACDAFARAALAFTIIGMLFGALWVERAWGGYWSWDPKETWAGITWLAYLLCLHVREKNPEAQRLVLFLYIFAFLCLLMCWQGINLIPSARADSIHLY